MKKRKFEFGKKLFLNKEAIVPLNQLNTFAGGFDTQCGADSSCGAICVPRDRTVTAPCLPDNTNAVQLTCRPDMCGLGPSAISCNPGVGCATGMNVCAITGAGTNSCYTVKPQAMC